jgi:endonuclease YncB( thermonuclease family)
LAFSTLTTAVQSTPPASTADQTLTLKVVGVHDGDTLTGLTAEKEQVKVRMDAIDAPELKQPFGQSSKKALSDKVFGKQVTVTTKKKDRYGRTVGHVLLGKRDINLEMLEEGMAWHYRQYSKNQRLQQAEDEARAKKKGLWSDPNPAAPWDWRKSEKERK